MTVNITRKSSEPAASGEDLIVTAARETSARGAGVSSSGLPSPARERLGEDLAAKGRGASGARKALYEAQVRQARAPHRNDLLPELKLVQRRLSELKAEGHAIRPVDPAHATEVATSIKMFGMIVPLLVAGDEIIDGKARAQAAKALGLETVPCIQVEHLSETEVRQVKIAVNALGEKGRWDITELRLELTELKLLEVSIDILGFSTPQLDLIQAANEEPAPEPEEELEPARGPPMARAGDLWVLGRHRVLCGDATQPESYRLLLGEEPEPVRLCLTDLPYNCSISGHVSSTGRHREFAMASGEMSGGEFEAFLTSVLVLITSVLSPGGLAAAFMDWRQITKLIGAGEAVGLELLNLVVWAKTQAAMGSLWRSQHELLPVFKKPGGAHANNVELGRHGRHRSNVWMYPGANTMGSEAREHLDDHPTPKPVAMLADAILDVTAPGEVVLDPFLGSGSTLMAAERTDRLARGMELDPGYVDVILRRWMKSGGSEPVLQATGEPLSAVVAKRMAELQAPPTEDRDEAGASPPDLPDEACTPQVRRG